MDILNTTSVNEGSSYEPSTVVTHDSFTVGVVSDNGSHLNGHGIRDTSSTTQDLINYYNDLKTYIYTFVPPVFITVGVLSNLLSLVVWVRGLLKKRGSSSSYFFACLAIADVIALLSISLLDHVANAYYTYKQDHSIYVNLRDYSIFLCKLYSFMFPFSISLTSYILASLALFRMIGIIYPHCYKEICSNRIAKIVILCIIVSTVLIHLQLLFQVKLVNFPGLERPVCTIPPNKGFISLFLAVLTAILDYFLPISIIVPCNIGIIWKLAKRKAQSDSKKQIKKGDHAFSRTVIFLVAVSFVYICTMSPMCVGIVLYAYINWRATTAVQLAWYKLFYAVALNLCNLNSSTNFFTYCLTHPQFVQEVKLCFAALTAKIESIFQKCKNINIVEITHARQVMVGTLGTSGPSPKIAIASTSGIKPNYCAPNKIESMQGM